MKNLLFSAMLLMAYLQTRAQDNDLELIYTVDVKTEKSGKGEFLDSNSVPGPTTNKYIIHLQKDGSFTSEKGGHITYNDLTGEIIFRYDPDTLYSMVPLHSVVDYRAVEFQNRVFLSNMLAAGGAEGAFGNLAALESLFGIEDFKNKIEKSIDVKTIDNAKVYSYNDNELARVEYSKNPIPAAYTQSFARYLTYNTEIHPSIQRKIVKAKLIPEYIQYTYTNVGTKTTISCRLQGSAEIKHTASDVLSKKRLPFHEPTTSMNGLIDSMSYQALFNYFPAIDSGIYFTKVRQLSNDGKNLSAMLGLMEYMLSSGDQPSKLFKAVGSHQSSDTQLTTFLSCMNKPRSKEEAEAAIAKLNSLIALHIKYGYVMNIFAANYIEPVSLSDAIQYFQKALSSGPYITGAWHDLGKIYEKRYEFDTAWQCYGIMMKLNPGHFMSKEIAEQKKQLSKSYPQYFKAN